MSQALATRTSGHPSELLDLSGELPHISSMTVTASQSAGPPESANGLAGRPVATTHEHGQSVASANFQAGEAHRVGSFSGAETHARSVLKAVSWRTMGTIDTFAISWFMTGKVVIAGSIAGLEVITKIAWYYLHERVWAAVSWGRR
jgi:uncharacterized membrane protein